MQADKLPRWAIGLGVTLGLALLFIGGRFMVVPEVAERGYGLQYDQPNNAFHLIKGIRDVFTGLLLLFFTLANWHKPLAVVSILGSLIPLTDMLIVLTTPRSVASAAWIHGLTVVTLLSFGISLLRRVSS